jgi:hypothetical protein
MNGTLLMSREDKLQILVIIEKVEDIQDNPSRVTENMLDSFPLEAFDDNLCACHFHGSLPLLHLEVSKDMNSYDIIFAITFP